MSQVTGAAPRRGERSRTKRGRGVKSQITFFLPGALAGLAMRSRPDRREGDPALPVAAAIGKAGADPPAGGELRSVATAPRGGRSALEGGVGPKKYKYKRKNGIRK